MSLLSNGTKMIGKTSSRRCRSAANADEQISAAPQIKAARKSKSRCETGFSAAMANTFHFSPPCRFIQRTPVNGTIQGRRSEDAVIVKCGGALCAKSISYEKEIGTDNSVPIFGFYRALLFQSNDRVEIQSSLMVLSVTKLTCRRISGPTASASSVKALE